MRVALCIGLAFLAAGCGGGNDIAPLPEGRFIAVYPSLTPTVQLFGEPVAARVDVLVDGEHFDPRRIRVAGFFEPFELDGEVVREQRDQDRYTHLRYEFTLRCLVWECLPHTDDSVAAPETSDAAPTAPATVGEVRDRTTHHLKAARILYDDPEAGTQRLRNVAWPEVVSVSRLNFSDEDVSVLGFPFEASVTPLPEASYRIPPTLLGFGLIAAALALLVLPAGLVVSSLRRRAGVVVMQEPQVEVSALERALAVVESSLDGATEERRQAIEFLAVELDVEERTQLAHDARRLAWSRTPPTPDEAGELVRAAREPE